MRGAQLPLPKRPFRDSAIFYGVLSILFVLVVWATGGAVLPRWDDSQREIGGLLIAILFFLVATSYSWWRFRQRIEEEEEEEVSAS
jgi:membrane protein DedA with SNARE-associated domain